jgi:hypothetical protein
MLRQNPLNSSVNNYLQLEQMPFTRFCIFARHLLLALAKNGVSNFVQTPNSIRVDEKGDSSPADVDMAGQAARR